MTKWMALGCALALGCVACTTEPEVPDPDAFIASIDAGPPPDAWAEDTGPPPEPVCTGTAVACAERERAECEGGCALEWCVGDPDECERNFSADTCYAVRGCSWGGDSCFGFPEPCEDQTSSGQCIFQGCSWRSTPACAGSPTPCSRLSESECLSQPGCRSNLDAGPPDAGNDGGRDAGPPDAGPLCRPMGACDPFAARSCGSGLQCIADSSGTRCVVPAFTLRREGDACSVDNQCEAGLSCLGGACRRMCRTGSTMDCTSGTVCGRKVRSADSCLRLCDATCDLYEQDCPTGQACVPFSPVPGESVIACLPEGTAPIGSSCMFADACVRGAACAGGMCERLCRTTADCAGSGTCSPTGTAGVSTCSL